MALPKEPRQKMINLMYLVLTALLALNVSSEILNAFKTVKSSLDNSSTLASGKTSQLFASFKAKIEKAETREKAIIWNEKAQQAHTLSDKMFKELEDLKMELMKEAGYNPPKDTTFKEDNLEASTRLFVEGAPHGKGKGKELYAKLEAYKNSLLAIDSSLKFEIGNSLPIDLSIPKTQNKNIDTWEGAYFHMTPTVAALTILSKFQNDVRTAEAQVVELCHKKIGEVEITYDAFDVIAAASPNYVMAGEDIVVTAGMGAFSTKAVPSITVNGASASASTAGKGQYEYKTKAESGVGKHQFTVTASYINPNTGKPETVTKTVEYTVGQPSGLTVSTDKTRVFYADGAENELSVTGSGGAEQIDVNITGPGSIEKTNKGGGTYLVKCTQPGKASVVVTDRKSGKTSTLTIPIKPVPDPFPKVAEKRSGDMSVSQFKTAQGVAARMDPGFVFGDMAWTVTSFRAYFTGAGFEDTGGQEVNVSGNRFNADIQKLMSKCQPGTTIIIDLIKIQNTAGSRRTLEESLTYVLN